jgi:hypothetical protein
MRKEWCNFYKVTLEELRVKEEKLIAKWAAKRAGNKV